ncbi:AAA family ATPase [Clostridium frigidicarnis]|uniref:PD-(D/E)XK nuclease superfamily protein n=1 Tax=Clostridium frigidicarnis TaxID=84698 RepID=A0A1I1AVF4_9CLOT|nr:PD-(D/E)XK nuclease superfamily protein [Clostridium frigidicarnis]
MKRISLGTSDFKKIIDNNFYFIDKTLIVKDFLEDGGEIVLLPRPRRFGKTLNLSILRYFLEKSSKDTSYLFKGLKIEKETEIMKKQGQYPLIYLTFKDDKHSNFENFIDIFRHKISSLYLSFKYLLDTIDDIEKVYFNDILYRRSTIGELEISLLKLSEYLNSYHDHKVIILIDEYDTPIHEGYFKNYYAEIIGFMRNFLSAALKDNVNLGKALITGILRVAKESIFSGLNNLAVYSILSEGYSDKFGFTEEETLELLKYYNLDKQLDEFKTWYNGYIFGTTTIYNPWSVLSYISRPDRYFMPYWVNTSENSIIKTLLAQGDEDIKLGLETLYNGGFVETTVNEDVVMSDISNGKENIWSFLLLSGYLKATDKYMDEDINLFKYKLTIPNTEIKILYRDIIKKWFMEGFISNDFTNMLKALVIGEVELFEEYFSEYILKSFSYFDISGQNPERVYHAFILGMLVSLSSTHEIVSNRESGLGRYDVSLIPKDISKPGIIMEFKSIRINSKMTLEKGMDNALNQINKKLYDTELTNRGVLNIIKLALVFKGKEVLINQC